MQVESVLEFRLNQDLYCFNTKQICYVFDLDKYEAISGIDESVVGIVQYNGDTMLLIDTLHLYNAEEHLDLVTQKSVVVIKDEDGSLYGMLVDEIVKIEDVEVAEVTLNLSSEDIVINHYKEKDVLVNEIAPLPLLHVKNVPAFRKEFNKNEYKRNFDKKEFLVFKIAEKFYAVEALKVKEVVIKEKELFKLEKKDIRYKGALSIRDEVIKVANIEEESKKEDVIVIENKGDLFCIDVDDILDIEEFDSDKIELLNASTSYIKAFYNFHANVIAIIDVDFFTLKKDEKKVVQNIIEEDINGDKEGYLVFEIEKKKFAMNMKNIRQVIHIQDISKAKSSLVGLNELTEFITTWNHHAVDVIKLDTLFGLQTSDDDSQVIILGKNEKLKGILVDNVEDILYISKHYLSTSSTDHLIDGAIIHGEELIPKINPSQIMGLS